jgi:hypothetical protein
MELLIFVVIAIAILGLLIGIVYLRKTVNIKDSDLDNMKLVLELINKLCSAYEWKWSGEIVTVCNYVLMALNIAKQNIDMTDKVHAREYIFMEAEKICELNNITVDPALLDLLGKIIDSVLA